MLLLNTHSSFWGRGEGGKGGEEERWGRREGEGVRKRGVEAVRELDKESKRERKKNKEREGARRDR